MLCKRAFMRCAALALMPGASAMRAAMRTASPVGALRGGCTAQMSIAAAAVTPVDTYDWTSDFSLVTTQHVPERQLTASLYRHKATGAEVLSIDADDENKVFSCNFRTLPKDDTGVPHILEHSVLCGSRKYPLKEPFVELLKGSLKTFLNAMTAPDKTMYPVASCNKQDFLNLVDVYLDACFHPMMRDPVRGPQILKQEGWHYEVSDPSTEKPLSYKGVVFNEMKGVYSSADQLHYRAVKKALFRGHPIYSIDSGGDPRAIPTLTYDAFEAFHKTYYHPANARLFVYGREAELPLPERLAMLQEYLGGFEAAPFGEERIPLQPLETAPYEASDVYPFDPSSSAPPTQFVTLAWLLNTAPLAPKTKLALSVLNHMLLGTAASALEQPLMASGLGASLTGGGYSGGLQQGTWSVGLKGVSLEAGSKEKVVELIVETLSKCAADGFEEDAIEASLNTVEFRLRSLSASPMKGMSFLYASLGEWNYGRDPIAPLFFEEALAELKAELAAGVPVFQTLLDDFLLANPHRLTFTLTPEATLAEQLAAAEAADLEAKVKELPKESIEQLAVETTALKAAQAAHDAPEELAKLPTLTIADLERKATPLPIEVVELEGGATLLTHDLPTDGIVYLDVALDLRRLALEDVPLLPLFSRMLSELGTATCDETAFSRRIGAQTGGLRTSYLTARKPFESGGASATAAGGARATAAVGSSEEAVAYLMLRGKSVTAKSGALFDLAAEMLTSTDLDRPDRAIEMLREARVRIEASVVSSGNSYASSAIGARFSLASHVDDLLGGLPQLATVKEVLATAESDWPTLHARLERMRKALLTTDGAIVNLSADPPSMAAATALVPSLLARLPAASDAAPVQAWQRPGAESAAAPTYTGLQLNTQVNYVAKGCPIYAPGEVVPGSSSVITRYLRTAYLWDKVRVQGGAYGCSLGFSRTNGVATYSSYRDPNVASSLTAYDATPAFLREHTISDAELSKAIIGAIGDLDSPMSIDSKGYTSMFRHLLGISETDRQRWRDEVLATTATDFAAFAERLDTVAAEGSAAVVASEKALAEANELLPPAAKLAIRPALE